MSGSQSIQSITEQLDLARRYEAARADVFGQLTAIERVVEEDFPAAGEVAGVTAYHVDALGDLAGRLAALLWAYERCDVAGE
jgi:hypothetical protein